MAMPNATGRIGIMVIMKIGMVIKLDILENTKTNLSGRYVGNAIKIPIGLSNTPLGPLKLLVV